MTCIGKKNVQAEKVYSETGIEDSMPQVVQKISTTAAAIDYKEDTIDVSLAMPHGLYWVFLNVACLV